MGVRYCQNTRMIQGMVGLCLLILALTAVLTVS